MLRLFFIFLIPALLFGSSYLPVSDSEMFADAGAVCVADLVQVEGVRSQGGAIHTQFLFKLNAAIYGALPRYFRVESPGGIYGIEVNADSRLPKLAQGDRYILFVDENEDKLVFINDRLGVEDYVASRKAALKAMIPEHDRGKDLTAYTAYTAGASFFSARSSAPSGYSDNGNGPRRFTNQDSGRPIPVILDLSTRPSGISQAQARAAVTAALSAWEAVSSCRFVIVKEETFSQSAESFSVEDGNVIRIQLHDNFNDIPDTSSTLGIGGSGFFIDLGRGGTLDGNAFNQSIYGYLIINHSKANLEDPVTLEEVLTHEIGHVIGLAHSSETPSETDPELFESIMYYQSKRDGRGAAINAYDINKVSVGYPTNTPPSAADRILYAVTTPNALSNSAVNQVNLLGFDLQGDPLTLQVVAKTSSNGVFSRTGCVVAYTPNGDFGDSTTDLEDGYYDRYQVRFSDGTNFSPTVSLRIVGFRRDTHPAGLADGLPDSWVTTHFGSRTGALAEEDSDGDGFTNLEEFRMDTDPKDANDRFAVTDYTDGTITWVAQKFQAYEIEASDDLSTWEKVRLVQSGSSSGSASTEFPLTGDKKFFRVVRQSDF